MTKLKSKKKSQTLTWIKTDRAYQYANKVCSGEILAGPWVRATCRRHIRDVGRFLNDPEYPFWYDHENIDIALGFFEKRLKLSGGQFEGEPFILIDWQAFIVCLIFGWKHKSDDTRRFRVAYIETPKGSGKSPLAAAIGLKGQIADNEPKAEIFAAATKQDQAMVMFGDAVSFYDKSEILQKRLTSYGGSHDNRNKLFDEKTGSVFKAISSERKGLSGHRPHMILLDEIHEHPDGKVIEMLRAGFKFRRQPLSFMITNSGSDKSSVCWEYHTYGVKVATGAEKDDTFFSYICSLDDEDIENDRYLTDESLWEKVNPSLKKGLPGYDYIRDQVREAMGMPSKMATVKRLCFCQWVEADNPWIDAESWYACKGDPVDDDLLKDRRCWGGMDLSRLHDLTALVLVWEPSEKDPVWRIRPFFWVPGEHIEKKIETDKVPYDNWRDNGWIYAPPTKFIKKSYVARELQRLNSTYNLQGVAYDRAMVNDLFQAAEDEGIDIIEGKWNKDEKCWEFPVHDGVKIMPFGQDARSMHPAIEKFEGWLTSGECRHDGNPCLNWCAANAVVKEVDDYRRLSKQKSTGRIDGIVAAVMACGVADVKAADNKSIYEETGVKTFG